jgi:predicted dehydrogenase
MDADAVFADPSIDAVIIAVRDHLQAGMAAQALAAGKAVYVEKPVATDEAGIAPVIAAQQAHGGILAVGYQKRFSPAYSRAQELVRSYGGAHTITLRMCDDAWRWATGYEPGYLVKHDACHFFDLLRWLTGQDAVEVMCMASRPDDDTAIIRFDGGAVATVINSGHGTMDLPKERCEIITERGCITVDDFVELRTYGFPDEAPVEFFAGAHHPDHGPLARQVYGQLGLDGMRAIRRSAWEMRSQSPDELGNDYLFTQDFLPNFTRNQGWLISLQRFVDRVANPSLTSEHADLHDAVAAVQLADAVITSRDEGRLVTLRPEGRPDA